MKEKLERKNGITLIALVITIIIMLILVTVTIRMVINGGLFNYAGRATGDMKNKIAEENGLLQNIKIGEETLEEYLARIQAGEIDEKFEEWDGTIATSFAGGDGSKNNPYKIENGSQLAYFAQQVNNGEEYKNQYIEIVKPIDLKNIPFEPISKGFTNTGDWSTELETRIEEGIFRGNLNGNNKWITNINIDMGEGYWSGIGFIGMMGENARIENIKIGEGNIKGNEVVGRISRIFFWRRDKKLCKQCKNYCERLVCWWNSRIFRRRNINNK